MYCANQWMGFGRRRFQGHAVGQKSKQNGRNPASGGCAAGPYCEAENEVKDDDVLLGKALVRIATLHNVWSDYVGG
ncbi:hypothetical protein M0657_001190 [Pyricularia oryzae]|uniref:Uncharacterized protein n=1 Tax=Pyricularia oryzae TaxID=318829 RepID=A0A4P7NNJ4_PYROR|nr:hypothetical protein M9X92_003859 [Pyricularia oryzae]KAI7931236.1 hypothetical protein M0657_001190 [Pyricularia oryzae]QBZ63895.1 hypothetical protein PoMZ_05586 [Pyricularia oryzae]